MQTAPILSLLADVRDLLARREMWLQVRQARAAQDALLADLSAVRQKAERRLAALRVRSRAAVPAPPVFKPPADWVPPMPLSAPPSRPTAPPPPRRSNL